MHLSYRTARPDELARHFDAMGEAFAYPADLRGKVPELWAEWLRDGVLMAHVIERHEPRHVTVEALGAMVFLAEGVIESLRREKTPYVRAQLMRRALAGEPVVLSPDAMREANRNGGLTLMFLADPRGRRGLDEAHYRLIDARWSEALYEASGCNLGSIWHEVYGERVMRHVAGCGLRLCEDWTGYWDTHASRPPDDERPYLLGISRAEAAPGTHAGFLFAHEKPRFEFTVRQQELLQRAMGGATDDELATDLSVSASAVKKRWVSVYERVSVAMPGWLDGNDALAEARGSEKRRHLLNYLRQHPEELHPACAQRD